jgi:dTMP kinase
MMAARSNSTGQPGRRGGRFITLEGIEGSGKSTQVTLLRDRLQAAGHRVVTTREPGGTPIGEKLREIVLHSSAPVAPLSELLVMFAARANHLAEVIRPALARGEWVVCDRFTDATFAYQGAGRGVDAQWIKALQALVHGDLQPDITLLLDVAVDVGLRRASARLGAAPPDRFEREKVDFFERVRGEFLAIAGREPRRVRVIDAGRPVEAVAQDIHREVRRLDAEAQRGGPDG